MPARRRNRILATLTAALSTLVLAACGGGGPGDATKLLRETFTGTHRVNSGNLGFSFSVVPAGSSTFKGPITLSLGGPFQSLGPGKLPQSAFSLSLGTASSHASATITSTGTAGYVTFQGSSYKLPRATFQRLESSFSQLGSSPGSSKGSSVLGRLGIQPEHWLVKPQIVGDEAISGTDTTHIRAGINVAALLTDLNTFLARASSIGVSGSSSFPNGISAATRSRLASEIHNPTFDVWTGKDDKTLRRLQINLVLPVSGQTSTLLGGLRSAAIGLTIQYLNLNQPQTITAPASVLPYSQFQAKLHVLLADLQGGLGGALGGGGSGGASGGGASSGAGGASAGSGGASSGANYQAYTACVQAAGSDLNKLQKCAPLLNGK